MWIKLMTDQSKDRATNRIFVAVIRSFRMRVMLVENGAVKVLLLA